jgi:hypothetical protein
MAKIDILLDSNSYFHFAIDFHPLLPGNYHIHNDSYRLSIIDNLQQELDASPRLQSKFYWTKQKRYVDNRSKNIIDLSSLDEADITNCISYIKSFSIGNASFVDLRALAIAEIMGIAIATDDRSMQRIADDIEVEVFTSLDMLELFHEAGKATKNKLIQVVHFWIENDDLPYQSFISEFEECFEIGIDDVVE